ncbi:uncharacterized protein LOC143461914 [Clavelina lepadiformis]|uniref:uncharacterized protein LOC143461914 n=1 Tax=Clavelina lepadiformis TaxID=159417 RepID=UPI004042D232
MSSPTRSVQSDSFSSEGNSNRDYQTTVLNVSIEGSNVTIGDGIQGSRGPARQAPPKPSSVDLLRQPIQHFTETSCYTKVLKLAQTNNVLILHCHGVPGSGKSEIIRKIAKQFPFYGEDVGEDAVHVKWHIQCHDSGHDVKEQMTSLIGSLRKHAILPPEDDYQGIIQAIEENTAQPLITALEKANIPVLLLLEDINKNEDSMEFTKDLLRSLNSKCKFHIYMATRDKSVGLSDSERKDIPHYYLKHVNGFEETEGLKFLLIDLKDENVEEKEAARKVLERFSGSPLGLRAAKGFCKESRISYRDYLDQLSSDDKYIQSEEFQNLRKEFGGKAVHVFQAVTMPFQIKEDSDQDEVLRWKILRCLSCMNYDRIPRSLLNECFCKLCENGNKSPLQNKIKSGQLITLLLNHEMCTKTDEDEITFHEVVTRAFRSQKPNPVVKNFYPLKEAIYILAGLATKDMRTKKRSNEMYKLIRHAESLLELVEQNMDQLMQAEDAALLRLLISHLYETFGAVMMCKSLAYYNDSLVYLDKALNLVWENEDIDLLNKGETSAVDVAKQVLQAYAEATEPTANLFNQYASKLPIYFDDEMQKYLEGKSKPRSKFKMVKDAINKHEGNGKLIEALRSCKVFLDDKRWRQVFFPERIASILHSTSRALLYADAEERTPDNLDKFMWISSLANSIAVECRKKYNVGLLCEHLSNTGGMIPIMLANKLDTNTLLEAEKKCVAVLDKGSHLFDMYEQGMLKEVYGPSHDSSRLQGLRNLVRIHARLAGKDNASSAGDSHCENLVKLAEKMKSSSSATLCFIYAAKYYAVKKNYEDAIICYKKFFEHADPKTRYQVYCWAAYNFARTVLEGEIKEECECAKGKCDKVLKGNEVMGADLNRRLSETMERMKEKFDTENKNLY